jgi:hypothetical protein
MKNPASRKAPRAGFSVVSDNSNSKGCGLLDATTPAQAGSLTGGIGCGAIWKSPRDRTRAIESVLREFNGFAFAEFRLMVMDGSGRMRPSNQRLTVSIKQLAKFSRLVGDTYRRAEKMGQTTGGSS